jgi:outer membrane receptor protein involved in Fe transport
VHQQAKTAYDINAGLNGNGWRRTNLFAEMRTGWNINSFLQCNAGIQNIFDRNYREHLDWGSIPRPGRNVYLNMIYKFSKTDEKRYYHPGRY